MASMENSSNFCQLKEVYNEKKRHDIKSRDRTIQSKVHTKEILQ